MGRGVSGTCPRHLLYRLVPYHTDEATAYSNLGLAYLQLADRERAKEYQDRALAIMVRKLGPDHTDVAYLYTYLGVDFSLSLTQISFRRSRRRDMVKERKFNSRSDPASARPTECAIHSLQSPQFC